MKDTHSWYLTCVCGFRSLFKTNIFRRHARTFVFVYKQCTTHSATKTLISAGNENTFNLTCKFSYVLYEWIHSAWNTSIIAFKSLISLKFGKNRNGKVATELNKCKSKTSRLGRRGFCHRNIYNCRMDQLKQELSSGMIKH